MASSFTENDVTHDKAEKRFYIQLPSGQKAFINYEVSPEGIFDMWHTEVPEECRGKGIAGILASKAITDLAVSDNSKSVLLSCTYLQHYYKKNSDKFASITGKKIKAP